MAGMPRRQPKVLVKLVPVRPPPIDPDRIEERLIVMKKTRVDSVRVSALDELCAQGKILFMLLWPDANGRTIFTVRYDRPDGHPKEVDEAVMTGLRRVFPTISHRDGIWSVTSDADRVMVNMLERHDLPIA